MPPALQTARERARYSMARADGVAVWSAVCVVLCCARVVLCCVVWCSDLLWSDPYEEGNESNIEHQAEAAANKSAVVTAPPAAAAQSAADTAWFGYNETRQCSYVFGYVITIPHRTTPHLTT